MRDDDESAWRVRLERDGLIERNEMGIRTTRGWHAAFARAAFRLFGSGEELSDIRVPITLALSEQYSDVSDEELAIAVRVMAPIAMRELSHMSLTMPAE